MIWYFIAGFVSGVAGMIMLGRYISRRLDEHGREQDE